MRCYLLAIWVGSLIFSLGLILHTGEAKVNTEAPAGPLYRVLGAPLTISCNVSGFKREDTRKEFQFCITKPANPTFEINIISTNDENFAYSRYRDRVRNGEITLKHTSPNSVLFEIQSLQKLDEGDYDCAVINSESTYNGVYNVKTTVKVIDNSLSVSSPVSASLSYNEGDALTLTCQASSNTIQHTHLSFAWYLHKDGEDDAKPIISLDRDFTLRPGEGFEGRYHAGLVRLDKVGEATYRLTVYQLQMSDQGRIYCRAQEWIQDPDQSWYPITQKNSEETTLIIKARAVVPDESSLAVGLSAQQTTLHEGQELSLSCSVDAHNLERRFLAVAWLREGVELARMGPTGVLSVGPEYSGREKGGELRAARIGEREYRLLLQPVRTEDQGEYLCRAWPQERGQDGAFTQGAALNSRPQMISISATESGLSVDMQRYVTVKEGERLRLACKVEGVKGQLSVTWQRQTSTTPTAPFKNIIGLSQEGVVKVEEDFMSRKIRAARPATDTFTLEVDEVTSSDSGVYHCAVSEWKASSKTHSQTQAATVTVVPTESFVKVNLISRNNRANVGESVELLCRVKGSPLPVTLIWSLQRDASTVDNILTLYPDGDISWSGDQHGYQLKVDNKPNEVGCYLLISSASHREAGTYQCRASVFLDNVHKKLAPSNPVAVMVQNPVSNLKLTAPHTLTRNINSDVDMTCSVTSEPSTSSRYAVTWLHQQWGENKTIASSDQDALVTFGTDVQPTRRRVNIRRTKGPTFELTLQRAQISDSGVYVCEVVEWLQDPRGSWYQLSPVSRTIELKLTEPSSDLQLDAKEPQQLIAMEGEDLELECNILSGAFSPSSFYKVTWLYTTHGPSVANVPIVELDHMGMLRYPENQQALTGLQGRLRLSRPTQSSFHLLIQRIHEEDSGTYQCQVEGYQLDHEGHWQQRASDTAGPITLTVTVAEQHLSVVTDESALNVSGSRDFTIPCDISKRSAADSQFQVTWFWQSETESKRQPIFTSYRNATLHDRFGKRHQLRFDHPVPNRFSLTVIRPRPDSSGLYSCEVEEWLPSPSHGWRRVAVEKSGYLTVNVFTEGDAAPEQQCRTGTWIWVLGPLVVCLLLVIFLMGLKMWRTKVTGEKRSGESLWAEEHPLNKKR